MKLNIGHLYGSLMNTYGDDGNIIVLKKRCQWRGIDVQVTDIEPGYKIKKGEFDLYFFGGGQDQSQLEVSADLVQSHQGKQLQKDLERGVPCLSICGGYQLLGEYYKPHQGPDLKGLNFLPIYTKASHDRMIGNILVQVDAETINHKPSTIDQLAITELVGFENHSGKTYLKEGATPLGKVIKGFGNNGEDGSEGCIHQNTIGCYMHGSLLPKNPTLADWLIQKALELKYEKEITLKPLDDNLEVSARKQLISRLS